MTETQVKSFWEGLIAQIQTNNKHALDEGKIKGTLIGANADTRVCRNKPADTVISTRTSKQHSDGVFLGPINLVSREGNNFSRGGECRFYIYGRAAFSDKRQLYVCHFVWLECNLQSVLTTSMSKKGVY